MGARQMSRSPVSTVSALLVLVLLLGAAASAAAAQPRVAILPFEVNAEARLDYLREGLGDMLASRLGIDEAIQVVGREQVRAALGEGGRLSDEKARALAARLGATHALYGSLTVIAGSLSLDARLVPLEGVSKAFFAEGQGMESLIPKGTELSSQVNAALTGRTAAPAATAAQARPAAQPPAPAAMQAAPAAPAPAAPAVALGASAVPPVQPAAPPGEGPFIRLNDESQAWRSRTLSFDVRGLAVADIDGDGRLEIIFLDERRVHVHRMEQANLVEVTKYEAPRSFECLGVDAADLNGNGRAEIYVTAMSNHKLASFVLELAGSKLGRMMDGLDYYLRVVDYPGAGRILVGQRMDREAAFKPGIFRLSWQGQGLVEGESLTTQDKLNVFNFSPIPYEKGVGYLAILSDDLLHLYSAGSEEWRSQDYYAGSHLYVEFYSRQVSQEEATREYLPQRILTIDGGKLIAAVANKGVLSRWLKTYKKYAGGELRLLGWNPHGLSEVWVSRAIEGYVADIAAGDIDGDGALELLAAVSMKTGWNPLNRAKSGLVVYRMPQQ